jgi:transcription elongation factor GreA
MVKTVNITADGLKDLEKELEELKARRPELAEKIATARSYGDLSENEDYSAARGEQKVVEGRILEIEEILKNASIIKGGKKDKVVLGATVSLDMGGKKVEYTIVGPTEANPLEGKLSNESPIGKLVFGKKAGEAFDFNGKKVKILEIK